MQPDSTIDSKLLFPRERCAVRRRSTGNSSTFACLSTLRSQQHSSQGERTEGPSGRTLSRQSAFHAPFAGCSDDGSKACVMRTAQALSRLFPRRRRCGVSACIQYLVRPENLHLPRVLLPSAGQGTACRSPPSSWPNATISCQRHHSPILRTATCSSGFSVDDLVVMMSRLRLRNGVSLVFRSCEIMSLPPVGYYGQLRCALLLSRHTVSERLAAARDRRASLAVE